MDIRRFGRQYRSQAYTLARATEVYATYYDIKYPNHERQAGRPLRLSPAYARLVELGASFGEKSAWERANWFEPNAAAGDESLRPRGWAGEHWSPAIHAEAIATRERAGLFDESSFAKFEVHGPGALELLQHLCANDVDRAVGSVTYTQMLNARGGIECDFTVTRLAATASASSPAPRSETTTWRWVRKHLPADGSVQLTDVTSSLRLLRPLGPARPRHPVAADAQRPVQRGFRYMTAQEISVGSVPCLAVRVTYVGELGWELYFPSEYGQALWDTLWAGRRRARHAWPAATARSTRCGSRRATACGASDMTPEETPDEAGLGFAVKPDKGDFKGREALLAQARAAGRAAAVLPGAGRPALDLPRLRAGAGGRRGGRPRHHRRLRLRGRALDRLRATCRWPRPRPGTAVEVEVFGEWVAAEVAAEPLWDPTGERIRA